MVARFLSTILEEYKESNPLFCAHLVPVGAPTRFFAFRVQNYEFSLPRLRWGQSSSTETAEFILRMITEWTVFSVISTRYVFVIL